MRSARYVGRPAAADTRANQTSSEPSVGPCPEGTAADTQYTTAPSDAEMTLAPCAVRAGSSGASCGFAVGRDAALSGAAERPLSSGKLPTLALARPLSPLFRGGGTGAADESAAVAAAATAASTAAAAAAAAAATAAAAVAAAAARAASPPVAAELPGCHCCCCRGAAVPSGAVARLLLLLL